MNLRVVSDGMGGYSLLAVDTSLVSDDGTDPCCCPECCSFTKCSDSSTLAVLCDGIPDTLAVGEIVKINGDCYTYDGPTACAGTESQAYYSESTYEDCGSCDDCPGDDPEITDIYISEIQNCYWCFSAAVTNTYPIVHWWWYLDGSLVSEEESFCIQINSAGTHNIRVVVLDDQGCYDTYNENFDTTDCEGDLCNLCVTSVVFVRIAANVWTLNSPYWAGLDDCCSAGIWEGTYAAYQVFGGSTCRWVGCHVVCTIPNDGFPIACIVAVEVTLDAAGHYVIDVVLAGVSAFGTKPYCARLWLGSHYICGGDLIDDDCGGTEVCSGIGSASGWGNGPPCIPSGTVGGVNELTEIELTIPP